MALPRTIHTFRSLLAIAALFTLQATASAADIAGVQYDDSIDLRGSKLQLNGAGVRYKAVFKVYTAGLYLGKKAGTPQEVASQAGSKRISITMLREIDAAELGKLFTHAVEDNIPRAESIRIIQPMLRMGQMFSDYKTLKAGDTFTMDWIPGTGTIITIKGKTFGEPFKEPEFFNALTSIWLGKSPADWQLKEALLGQKKS
jgi:Chalcone isomerase-like